MILKTCQLNTKEPCVNRGQICLRSKEAKEEFNNFVEDMCKELDCLKFKELYDSNISSDAEYSEICSEVNSEGQKTF